MAPSEYSSDGNKRYGVWKTSVFSISDIGVTVRKRKRRIFLLFFRCVSFACFAISNMLLPMILTVQMVGLDVILYQDINTRRSVFFTIPIELALLVHMLRHAQSSQAIRDGSLQWIVYSWLIATKCCLLYFWVLNKAAAFHSILGVFGGDGGSAFFVLLYLTPVFYCILTFRTLRQLFTVSDDDDVLPGFSGRFSSRRRDRQEHMTLDVVLLQDMVWHVVIDMIDMNSLMKEFSARSMEKQGSVSDARIDAPSVRAAVGVFITLALFFHQQSFPSCSVISPEAANFTKDTRESWSDNVTNTGTIVSDFPLGHLNSTLQSQRPPPVKAVEEHYADVVKARKRSAIVSIILVDLPFFVIRTYIWSIAANATLDDDAERKESSRPVLDKWLVKNMLCMLLQAMQLRFVQQADLERSQSLKWWERGGKSFRGEFDAHFRRRKRCKQDPHLRQVWQEMDRSKLEAAMAAAGSISDLNLPDATDSWGTPHGSEDESDAASSKVPNQQEGNVDSVTFKKRRARSFWACCCTRTSHGRCRCCSCDCSHSVVLHAVMGLVLGWLTAKVDFEQAFSDLKYTLGWQD